MSFRFWHFYRWFFGWLICLKAVEKLAVDKLDVDKLAVEKLAVKKLAINKFAVDKLAVEKFPVWYVSHRTFRIYDIKSVELWKCMIKYQLEYQNVQQKFI